MKRRGEDDDEVLLLLLEVDDEDNSESLVDDANDGHRLVVSSTRLSRHLLVATFFILGGRYGDIDGSAADDDNCELGPLRLPTFRANAKLLSRSSNCFC